MLVDPLYINIFLFIVLCHCEKVKQFKVLRHMPQTLIDYHILQLSLIAKVELIPPGL
jgi:hypothetical protein